MLLILSHDAQGACVAALADASFIAARADALVLVETLLQWSPDYLKTTFCRICIYVSLTTLMPFLLLRISLFGAVGKACVDTGSFLHSMARQTTGKCDHRIEWNEVEAA